VFSLICVMMFWCGCVSVLGCVVRCICGRIGGVRVSGLICWFWCVDFVWLRIFFLVFVGVRV